MLPHPGTPRFLTLILSANPRAFPAARRHRHRCRHRPFAFSVLSRVSASSPQTFPLSDSEDRSLSFALYPALSLSCLRPKRNREDGENLNSLLGLLIPRIDAEFRALLATPHISTSALTITTTTATTHLLATDRHLRSSARSFGSPCSHDPHEASWDVLENLRYRSDCVRNSLGITSIDRTSE